MELGIIKNDVVNELRSQRYFNEQEITRLVQTDSLPHKSRIVSIGKLTRENAGINEALKLLEVYFPAAQPPLVAPASPPPTQPPTQPAQ